MSLHASTALVGAKQCKLAKPLRTAPIQAWNLSCLPGRLHQSGSKSKSIALWICDTPQALMATKNIHTGQEPRQFIQFEANDTDRSIHNCFPSSLGKNKYHEPPASSTSARKSATPATMVEPLAWSALRNGRIFVDASRKSDRWSICSLVSFSSFARMWKSQRTGSISHVSTAGINGLGRGVKSKNCCPHRDLNWPLQGERAWPKPCLEAVKECGIKYFKHQVIT